MKSLPERIMEHAEATPICPAALLHLGQRAAVGQALSRLARSGRLMRIRQGGLHAPDRVPLRAVCAEHREVTPGALGALGRDDRLERRSRESAQHRLWSGLSGTGPLKRPGGSIHKLPRQRFTRDFKLIRWRGRTLRFRGQVGQRRTGGTDRERGRRGAGPGTSTRRQ